MRRLHGAKVRQHIAAKIRRIVTVEAEADAALEENADRHVRDAGHAFQPHVAERTDGDEELAGRDVRHEGLVGDHADAVVDAGDIEGGEGGADHLGPALFAGVRGAADALLGGATVDVPEEGRGEAEFGAVEADAEEGAGGEVGAGVGDAESLLGLRGGQVPQEAEDQARAHVQLAFGAAAGAREAGDNGVVGHAALRVSLRVEEDFGVDDAVGVRALEVFPGEELEVAGLEEAAHALDGRGVLE